MAAKSGIEAIDNDQNVMRLHAAFFDRNNDGVVYPWETYQGIRAIGGGFLVSLAGGILINLGLSGLTRPIAKVVLGFNRPGKWFPNLLFPIELENITLAKHGSDSDTYDRSGRFVPSKFEEIFSKYARTNPDSLTKDELNEYIKGNRDPKDYFGQIAALGE
ncbi:caleosin-related, EF-hand domain pair [Artemisia annua]|uniref:Caleosin-related, EF-hand domain pair n=1 Tax=Artemisia annua TaxID=35608 RepID=A0A2U1P4P7_ARTAN|nr:caleosin-related, EF-hand domain pair [Artemisia annua]